MKKNVSMSAKRDFRLGNSPSSFDIHTDCLKIISYRHVLSENANLIAPNLASYCGVRRTERACPELSRTQGT